MSDAAMPVLLPASHSHALLRRPRAGSFTASNGVTVCEDQALVYEFLVAASVSVSSGQAPDAAQAPPTPQLQPLPIPVQDRNITLSPVPTTPPAFPLLSSGPFSDSAACPASSKHMDGESPVEQSLDDRFRLFGLAPVKSEPTFATADEWLLPSFLPPIAEAAPNSVSSEDTAISSSVSPVENMSAVINCPNTAPASCAPVFTKPWRAMFRRQSLSDSAFSGSSVPEECSNCRTTKTSTWRRAADGSLICNACKLYLNAHGTTRPVKLRRKEVVRRRSRSGKDLALAIMMQYGNKCEISEQQQQQQQDQPQHQPQHHESMYGGW
ncbi:putative electron transfer flavoprotein subunit [Entophlyctis luteolus]|nr:putative electron transfer flavoprotein subunit [Entophlyctis luteolus]